MSEVAFDSDLYLEEQYGRIQEKMAVRPDSPTYIEFGGKPGDDHHAARVLPGYRPDVKTELLKSLMPEATIAMVVNARDVLLPPHGRYDQGRIRGDSGLFYSAETLRLVDWLDQKGLKPDAVVLSIAPRTMSEHDAEIVGYLEEGVEERGIKFARQYCIDNYPSPEIIQDPVKSFGLNEPIVEADKNLIVFSPGGGSGKFGLILSELYNALAREIEPNFIKFETFPVFNLPARHPLNLAFEAATADLANSVSQITDSTGKTLATYDKDIENFALLKELFRQFGKDPNHPIVNMTQPTDMGVNVIEKGIKDMGLVISASKSEILRRYRRYRKEVNKGIEKQITVQKVKGLWLEAKAMKEV